MENEVDLGERAKKRKQQSVGAVDVDPEDVENVKESGREVQGAPSYSKNCRERVCSLCRI